MDAASPRVDLSKALDDMSHLLILARMGARDGEFQRVKDAVAEIIRGATAVYLAASHLHNEESR